MATEGIAAALVLIQGVTAVLEEIRTGGQPSLTDQEVDDLVSMQKTSKENALAVLQKIIEKQNQ